MAQRIKRYAAIILSFAMMITMFPTSIARAAEGTSGTTQKIPSSKFVASGGQGGADTWLIATTERGSDGTERSAAYVKDETATDIYGNLGTARIGAVAFALPGDGSVDPELVSNATVTMHVTGCNKDNMGDRKTKAGLFRVDPSYYDGLVSDGKSDSTATDLYPALDNDYSKAATVYCQEWLTKDEATDANFDVTEWVREALKNKDAYAIFRLETVICGFDVVKNGEQAPYLSITTITEQEAVDQAKDALTLPESVKTKLELPLTGLYGSTITWRSSNPDVLSHEGAVVKAQERDMDVTMTATIKKGTATATRDLKVTVKGEGAEQSTLRVSYTFAEEDLTDKVIADTSGNGFDGELKGNGATVKDGALILPGGAAGSSAAYVSIPKEVFVGQDTLTINVWLKNQTGSNNYSAMFFGTKTKHVDSSSSASMPLNYWLLNPAQPDGYFKSVWTDSNNASAPYNTETPVSKTKTGSDWAMYTTVVTPESIKGYLNGTEVCSNAKTKKTTDFGTDLVAFIGRSSYNDMFYKGGVYGVSVYGEAFTPDKIQELYNKDMPSEYVTLQINTVKEKLASSLGDLSEVTGDLVLPTEWDNGVKISWSSSKPEVISNDGKVTRPESRSESVTLIASVSLGGKSDTVQLAATVLDTSKETQMDYYVKHLAIGRAVLYSDIELPGKLEDNITISWTSSNTDVLKLEGAGDKVTAKVTRPAKEAGDAAVTLTASLAYNDSTEQSAKTKDFKVTVRAEDYGFLMAYTNSKESASLGNSLHLAYSQDALNYTALNSNTGICFANNAGGSKNSSPNGLQDMYIFRKADGTYGMAAKNVSSQKYVYIFDSEDLVHFTNERKLALDTNVDGDLEVSQYAYDGTSVTYAVYWRSGSKNYRALTKDFATVIEQGETAYSAAHAYTTDIIPPEGAAITDILGVNSSEYQYVVNKLDVVKNTGIQKVNVTAKAGDDLTKLLPEKVTADYSDGTTADFGVVWNEQDVAKVDLDKKGAYTVTGVLKQTQYMNPFIEQRADPCILKGDDGYYYFTASYPMCGGNDKDGYDKVVLRRAQTIEGLAQAEEVTIWDCDWNPGEEKEYRYIWAPEIRLVNGSYYVFYTSSVESGSVWGIRPHVLKCTNPADIMNKDSWKTMGMMQRVAGDSIAFTGFSLDMTVFENQGRWYVIWAQTDGYSSLFLAEINPDEPWKCISQSVKISVPEYSWERQVENVDEGPSVIKNNGKIYVAFSASGTGPEYCIGLLSIDENADMLDKDAWVKQPYPVLTSSDVPGEYGPGHNSFTVDEEGNPIFVYHARGQKCYDNQCDWANQGSLYDPCRDARLKRVHWAADGTPILKMSYEEELAPENRTITATINVEGDEEPPVVVPVKSVTLNKSSLTLAPGKSTTLTAEVNPSDATDKIVTWNSTNEKVATVKNGKVTAKKAGTTTIVATAGGKTASCKVTVKIAVESVKLGQTKVTLGKGEKIALGVSVKPSNATSKKVTWGVDKKSIATVSQKGVVTAKKAGKAVITAKADGKTAKCTITVKNAPKSISLNAGKKTLKKGKKFQIKAKLPKNTASYKITYKSSNEKVAKVDAKGKVTAKKKGTATITVKTFNNKKAKLKVTVK